MVIRSFPLIMIITIFTCINAMEETHRYQTCHNQESVGGCQLCCDQYPCIWFKYANDFENNVESIAKGRAYPKKINIEKLGNVLLQAFSQKQRTDQPLHQLTVVDLIPHKFNKDSFDPATNLKTLKLLWKSNLISANTFSRALKICSYHRNFDSLIMLQKYYALKGLSSHDERCVKKAKLCGDVLAHEGKEIGSLRNGHLLWELGQEDKAREYFIKSPGSLHAILPLLKLLRPLAATEKESLARLILFSYYGRLLQHGCIMCNAGLCGFYHGVNSYAITIPRGLRGAIETIIGKDDEKFRQRQGTAALSSRTLMNAMYKDHEQTNNTICPVSI